MVIGYLGFNISANTVYAFGVVNRGNTDTVRCSMINGGGVCAVASVNVVESSLALKGYVYQSHSEAVPARWQYIIVKLK